MIYLTSFYKSKLLPENMAKWSAAVYQPKGFNYPKATVWEIVDEDGMLVSPREYALMNHQLLRYRKALMSLYSSRHEKITKWVKAYKDVDIALCCWCPYEKAAQRQLEQFGSFICHLSVVGLYLYTHFPEQNVWLDGDRLRMAVLSQKGQ
jgi:hypothetical protein